jgi:alpha-ketoglutarate-dependent dioxygenase FTO
LRNIEPYKQSFQTALDTCYEGFAVDMSLHHDISEETVQNALLHLEKQGFFRTDVTQPFGLGTKCAKTFVTRCLVGDQGTTYKYLGLRMFSKPWNNNKDDALQAIKTLNHVLTKRTEHHLSELDKRKRARGASVQGRAGFDIVLINRMEHLPELKKEPSLGQGKCAVSWHADSSLEHYSTIAVYQTLVGDKVSDAKDWSVALRVAHHAEGPESSRRGTDIQSTLVADAPTLSVFLPSGSAYYLLDDFNHHHQHAVVSEGEDSDTVRYSCTHRLLRQSHNVNFMLERCQNVVKLFHKKGSKIWRSEQLLLTEVESEWIRQFYIQGQAHYDLLWADWSDSMQRLLRYWSQLETRTKQTIDLLQLAAEARCGSDGPPSSKVERKRRDKRKKALETVDELVSRVGTARTTAIQSLYDPLADLLRERAEMRRLWRKREEEHVFRELDRSQRPLPVPFEYGMDAKSDGGKFAVSPMPEDLSAMADRLVALGRAFVSGDEKYLPEDCLTATNDAPPMTNENNAKETRLTTDEHSRPLTWVGWNDLQFGLEMQSPWAGLLIEKRKTIETRAYDLPPALVGKRIEILQSNQGSLVSSLDNVVPMTGEPLVTRVGWCIFTNVIRYENEELFDADQDAHWVTRESDFYPFNEGKKTIVYGWIVGEVGSYTNKTPSVPLKAIARRYRSLFELQVSESSSKGSCMPLRKRKKRRRY